MTLDDLRRELPEAPTADGLIDGDYWDSVFEEIDDPEALREMLKKMERYSSFHIKWGSNGIPEEVWVR